MSSDLHAAGTALAEKFAAVTAPTGTMGGTAIKAHSVGVQTVAVTPCIIVELPSGQPVSALGENPRRTTHDFEVFFLFGKASGDVPRDTAVMLKWLGPLLSAVDSGNALGLEDNSNGWQVLKSQVTDYEPGQYSVGGQPYHSWKIIVRVWTSESVTLTQ